MTVVLVRNEASRLCILADASPLAMCSSGTVVGTADTAPKPARTVTVESFIVDGLSWLWNHGEQEAE